MTKDNIHAEKQTATGEFKRARAMSVYRRDDILYRLNYVGTDFVTNEQNSKTAKDAAELILDLHDVATQSPWQPIETAPKDGAVVFLYCVACGFNLMTRGSFRVDDGFSGDREPLWLDMSYDDFTIGYSSVPLNPTHWMPLPKAPS